MSIVLSASNCIHDSAKHIADSRTEDQQNGHDDNRRQDNDQPVLEKTLPLFVWQKEHFFPLSFYYS
jgi:hypothetical protein